MAQHHQQAYVRAFRQAIDRKRTNEPVWRYFDRRMRTRAQAIGLPPGRPLRGEAGEQALAEQLEFPRAGRRRRLCLQLPGCCGPCARRRPAEMCSRLRGSWIGLSRQIRALSDSGWAVGGPLEAICFIGLMPRLTPAPILARLIEQARQCFLVTDDCEVTVESSLCGLDQPYLLQLAEAGVNRLRLPIIAFGDDSRREVGCGGDAADLFITLEAAHDAGIESIAADLIYGLPGRSAEAWRGELDVAAHTPVSAILLHSAAAAVGGDDDSPRWAQAEHREFALAQHVLERRAAWTEVGVGHFGAIGYETDRSVVSSDRSIDTVAAGGRASGRVGNLMYRNPQDWQPWIEGTAGQVAEGVHVRDVHPLHLAALDWYAMTESLAPNRPAHPDLAEPMAELLDLLDNLGAIDAGGAGVTLTQIGRFWAGNIAAAIRAVVDQRCAALGRIGSSAVA